MNLTLPLVFLVSFGWALGFMIAGVASMKRYPILSGAISAISSMLLVLAFLLFCFSWGKQPYEAWNVFLGHFDHWIKWFVTSMIVVAFVDYVNSVHENRNVSGFEIFSEIWWISVVLWLGACVIWDWILPLIGRLFQAFGGVIYFLWQMGTPPG